MTIRVLFVDDETQLLESLRLALRRADFQIFTAASAEDALEFLASHDVDVVVSDERMPGTQGSELLAQVRAAMPDTVRILLTGQASVDAAVRAVNDAAVHRFLLKPTSPKALRAAIEELHAASLHAASLEEAPPPTQGAARVSAREDLERTHPGITQVRRDRTGAVLLDPLDTAGLSELPRMR